MTEVVAALPYQVSCSSSPWVLVAKEVDLYDKETVKRVLEDEMEEECYRHWTSKVENWMITCCCSEKGFRNQHLGVELDEIPNCVLNH